MEIVWSFTISLMSVHMSCSWFLNLCVCGGVWGCGCVWVCGVWEGLGNVSCSFVQLLFTHWWWTCKLWENLHHCTFVIQFCCLYVSNARVRVYQCFLSFEEKVNAKMNWHIHYDKFFGVLLTDKHTN